MKGRRLVRDLLAAGQAGGQATVAGWVRSVRQSKHCAFVALNDGSCQQNLQLVTKEAKGLSTGDCVQAYGELVASPGQGQALEMQAKEITLIGQAGSAYPLQKKATGLEFLRDQAHLRMRTNLFGAIFRIRHRMSMAIHQFFDSRGFYLLHSPILTTVDAEGAGESFRLEGDYFGESASLCVSGQLEAECFALGMNAVYTFGPTFRAENSNTPRHLAEFWMVEPEAAFMDLEGNAKLAMDTLAHIVDQVIQNCPEELQALEKYHAFAAKQDKSAPPDWPGDLEKIRDGVFEQITYTEALELCRKSGRDFQFGTDWGIELQTEHERFLAEEVFRVPVVVTDYPKEVKAFYMKQNDDGKTVRAMDVLLPTVGEIIGGSQREDDLGKLSRRMDELGMDKKQLDWYLDLRRFGSAPHSGFGLGLERLVRHVTGMKNIRDCSPFPRTPGNCRF